MAAADVASAVSSGTPAELVARKKPLVDRVVPKLRNYYSSWNTMTRVSLDCIREDVQGER